MSISGAYRRAAVYGFSFLAGICALTYEVVWARLLEQRLGSADLANGLVLALFMGGLALGARLFGPLSDRLRFPLRAYGLLEIGTGLCAVASSWALTEGTPEGTSAAGPWLAAISLLPPTILMGAAFPLLIRALTARTADLRRTVGRLYAVNTAGCVLGGLLAGFVLLDHVSPPAALRGAGLLNALLGVALLALFARAPSRLEAPDLPVGVSDAVCYGAEGRRLALLLAAFSGVATMALEVAWTRRLADVLGDSTRGLTLMLTALLSGSALGALFLASRLAGRVALPDLVAGALVATSGLLLVTQFGFEHWAAGLSPGAPVTASTYLMGFVVLLLPMLLAGIVFPAAVRLGADEQHLGGRVGQIYAVNTVGTLGGALLAGLYIVPTWGGGAVLTAVVIAYGLAGLAMFTGVYSTFSATMRNWRPRSTDRV